MEPQMNADERRFNAIMHTIIGCAFKVANALGVGFLEKVYENALAYELRKAGLHVVQQQPVNVMYDGVCVGEYVADLLVDGQVLVELKAAKGLHKIHMAQCLNYLKASFLNICLLLNFGTSRIQIERIVHNL